MGHQANQLRRGCNILVATPGRLLDFAERGHVNFSSIQFLILDEADRMLDRGFMPDIRRAIIIPSMPSKMNRQTLMFSATFPSEIQRLAGEFLNNYLHLQVGLVGGACADVMQTFYRASKYEKKDKFISILNEDGRNAKERTLVFVETKRQADFLCLNLCEEGFPGFGRFQDGENADSGGYSGGGKGLGYPQRDACCQLRHVEGGGRIYSQDRPNR